MARRLRWYTDCMPVLELPAARTYFQDLDGGWSKLVALISHVAAEYRDEPCFGRTKLAAALFLCDFRSFALHGRAITGVTYRKFEHSPYSGEIDEAVESASHLGWESRGEGDYEQRRVVTQQGAAEQSFTPEEWAVIKSVVEELRGLTAEESARAARGLPWELTEALRPIAYEYSFLGNPDEISAAELAELEAHLRTPAQ